MSNVDSLIDLIKRVHKKHNKKCYRTKKHCLPKRKQALSFATRVSAETDKPIFAYKCPFCNYWHVTSQDQYTLGESYELYKARRCETV